MNPELPCLYNKTGVIDSRGVTQMSLQGSRAHFPSCWEEVSRQPSVISGLKGLPQMQNTVTPKSLLLPGTTVPSPKPRKLSGNNSLKSWLRTQPKPFRQSNLFFAQSYFSFTFHRCQPKITPNKEPELNLCLNL